MKLWMCPATVGLETKSITRHFRQWLTEITSILPIRFLFPNRVLYLPELGRVRKNRRKLVSTNSLLLYQASEKAKFLCLEKNHRSSVKSPLQTQGSDSSER